MGSYKSYYITHLTHLTFMPYFPTVKIIIMASKWQPHELQRQKHYYEHLINNPEVLCDVTMPVLSRQAFAGYQTTTVVKLAFGIQNYSSK
jgi:hypothetical protein